MKELVDLVEVKGRVISIFTEVVSHGEKSKYDVIIKDHTNNGECLGPLSDDKILVAPTTPLIIYLNDVYFDEVDRRFLSITIKNYTALDGSGKLKVLFTCNKYSSSIFQSVLDFVLDIDSGITDVTFAMEDYPGFNYNEFKECLTEKCIFKDCEINTKENHEQEIKSMGTQQFHYEDTKKKLHMYGYHVGSMSVGFCLFIRTVLKNIGCNRVVVFDKKGDYKDLKRIIKDTRLVYYNGDSDILEHSFETFAANIYIGFSKLDLKNIKVGEFDTYIFMQMPRYMDVSEFGNCLAFLAEGMHGIGENAPTTHSNKLKQFIPPVIEEIFPIAEAIRERNQIEREKLELQRKQFEHITRMDKSTMDANERMAKSCEDAASLQKDMRDSNVKRDEFIGTLSKDLLKLHKDFHKLVKSLHELSLISREELTEFMDE